jgi:hypothetical protein
VGASGATEGVLGEEPWGGLAHSIERVAFRALEEIHVREMT